MCLQSPIPVGTRPPVRVFVSSPFVEFCSSSGLRGKWPLRATLCRCLQDAHHIIWLYEDERKKADPAELSDEELISEGVKQSDVVVVLLKTRAGTLFRPYPIHATVWEMLKAIVFEKPIFLYLVGSSPDEELRSYLAVLRNRVFIVKERLLQDRDDNQICHVILQDVESFGRALQQTNDVGATDFSSRPEDFGPTFYENAISRITEKSSQFDYFGALRCVKEIPVSPCVQFSHLETRLYAEVLALCGAIHANMMRFLPAVTAKRISIRLYFKVWDFVAAFSQISALSGVLQMFGDKDAHPCNNLALQGAESDYKEALKNLLPGVLDARGSILMHQGLFAAAADTFGRVIRLQKVESPYILTKLIFAEGRASGRRGISRARTFADTQILPWARATNRDLPFAIKGSARLAIWDGDYAAALPLISESQEFCLARGLFHPLKELAEMEHICRMKLAQR
jgi:hypothetical protein